MESLLQQIERIIEEGEGERRSIIVHVSGRQSTDSVLDRATEILGRRHLILSARDTIPCPILTRLGGGNNESESLFLNGQPTKNETSVTAPLKQRHLNRLATVLESDIVKKYLQEANEGSNRDACAETFWTGCAISLNVLRDDLLEFRQFDPHTTFLFKNDRLPLQNLAVTTRVSDLNLSPSPAEWGIQKINALSAWGSYNVRGAGVKIGMLDSGADPNHPDLKDKIADWAEFDDCGRPVPKSVPHDVVGHGTQCAGNLVGGNHSGKYIGVAPEAKLSVGLVLDENGAHHAQILAGMDWAIDTAVDVLNMSIGKFVADSKTPPYFACAILSAIKAGILPIIPIGNEGEQTSDTPGNDLLALSTGATNFNDEVAGFSGGRTQIIECSPIMKPEFLPFIYRKPDVSAPGVAIRTSKLRSTDPIGQDWAPYSGTSLGATHLSGAIALLLQATTIREKLQGSQRSWYIRDIITGSVEELGESGQDARFGFGRIDVLRAIAYAHECGYKP
jgi:subtilisin family serine protease